MKQILLVLSILFCTEIKCQDFNITFMSKSPYMFGSKDIWNFILINTTESITESIIQVDILTANNKKIYTSTSVPLILEKGANNFETKYLNTNNNYYNSLSENSDKLTGTFPSGTYLWCISVLNPSSRELLYSNCNEIKIEIPTKPLLISPCDECVISDQNPMFLWLGANLIDNESSRYRLSVFEVESGQNSAEAVFRNRPILQLAGLKNTYANYPFNSPSLIYGKNYAWKVDFTTPNGEDVSTTEIWTFTLKLDSVKFKKTSNDDSYIDIVSSAPNVLFTVRDEIKLKFITRKYPLVLSYRIFKENENNNITDGELQVLAKENWYIIDIANISKLRANETYKLELNDSYHKFTFYFNYNK